jgi:Fe-S oxidoreductase
MLVELLRKNSALAVSFVDNLTLGEIRKYTKLKKANYIELAYRLTEYKILFISFNLDGILSRIELGDGKRPNRVILLSRNYNGMFAVNVSNLTNLKNLKLNFYVDYYNENMRRNDEISKQLVADVRWVLNHTINVIQSQQTYTISFQSGDYNWSYQSLPYDIEMFLNIALEKCVWENVINFKAYPCCITVLPPDIRPDLNPQYCVVQTSTGCRVKDIMGRACYFCSSYNHTRFIEHSSSTLAYELAQLLMYYPKSIQRSRYCFFADGDAIAASNFLALVSQTKHKLPNILGWESFISTYTILNMPDEQWGKLLESGLTCVYWGVESADNNTLQFLGKPQSEQQLKSARQILENMGIPYAIIVMCGFSKISSSIDLSKHIEKTCLFINESKCSKVYISKLNVLPETELFRQFKEEELIPMLDCDIEYEYRFMIHRINKPVNGAYGNQFM